MSEISQFHDLAEVCRKIDKPVEMSADAIICLDNEIVELERVNTKLLVALEKLLFAVEHGTGLDDWDKRKQIAQDAIAKAKRE